MPADTTQQDGVVTSRRTGSRVVRYVGVVTAVTGLAVALFAVSTVVAPPRGAEEPALTAGRTSVEATSISGLQERLDRVPEDHIAWSALGSAYVNEAVATADPAYYSKADAALQRSLEIRPEGNDAAVTGQAALAASQHEFTTALELARDAQELNPYSTANQAVLVDALVELGRYEEAERELQQMMDLKPSVPALMRVSYFRELHGDIEGARAALEQAGAFAFQSADTAQISHFLGELAFSSGDITAALRHYDHGLQEVPQDPALLAGRAEARVAAGQLAEGLEDYRVSISMLPEPAHIGEYAAALTAAGRSEEAAEQEALIRPAFRQLQTTGSNVDLELAMYEADAGNGDAAVETALRERDRRSSVHTEDALGWALHVAGDDERALAHAEAAERLSDTNAAFAFHRGIIEHELGMKAEARQSLERALRLNPHFSAQRAEEARQILKTLAAK